MTVWSPKAQTVAAELAVGGLSVFSGDLTLPSGESDLVVPFDPSRFAPCSYAYALTFKDAKDAVLLDDAGTVEIRGRVEPDASNVRSASPVDLRPFCQLSFMPLLSHAGLPPETYMRKFASTIMPSRPQVSNFLTVWTRK